MREVADLNYDWHYWIKENQEERFVGIVHLPHTNIETPYNNFNETIYQFESIYRKKILISHSTKNKQALLHFEGVMCYARVFLNGILVGEHKGGYTPFKINLTTAVIYDEENLIEVHVDSRERPEIPPFGFVVDYLTYGGIYREVRIEYVHDLYIQNCHVMTKDVLKEEKIVDLDLILERSSVTNRYEESEMTIKGTFLSKDLPIYEFEETLSLGDETCCHYGLQTTIRGVEKWDLNHPVLYDLDLTLFEDGRPVDQKRFRFGFRQVAFLTDGLYLNGEKVKILGLNRHQSYPYVGYAMPKRAQEKDAEILKYELGVNTVRTSHYPQSQHFLNRCDEIGLLVFDEIPGWQHIGDTEEWQRLTKNNVRDMIMADWNHPSVFIWGVRINESPDCEDLYLKTNEIAHQLDPTRPTGGVRYMEGSQLLEDVYTFNDFSHVGNNKGLKNPHEVAKKAVPYLVTEFNGHMFPTKKFDGATQRIQHLKRHLTVINDMYLSIDIAGCIGWCMFDYNTHKDFGSGDRICYHGVQDMFRISKYAAYAYASQQSEKDVLFVANEMEIGDFPGGLLGDTLILTNCEYVKVYKNEAYIDTFYPDRTSYSGLPHPPILVDQYMGRLIHENEGFTDRDAETIKAVFIKLSKLGEKGLLLSDKLKMLKILWRYKLKYTDLYALYGRYVGNWGNASTSYKYEGYRDGKLVATSIKTEMGELSLHVTLDSDTLLLGKTYDVTRIVITLQDDNGKVGHYSDECVVIDTNGPIKVIGPTTISLIGGSRAFWVKTCEQEGTANIQVRSHRYGTIEKRILVKTE